MKEKAPSFLQRRRKEITGFLVTSAFFASLQLAAPENEDQPFFRIDKAIAGTFPDVSDIHPYSTAIENLKSKGVIDGYKDGTFGAEKHVLRQQFAKMLTNTLNLRTSEDDLCPYSDVENSGFSNLYPDNYISVVSQYGIAEGRVTGTLLDKKGKFDPTGNVTRAQAITMIVRSVKQFYPEILKEVSTSSLGQFDQTHSQNVALAEASGFLNGLVDYGKDWDPFRPATRGELSQLLWNLRQIAEQQRPESFGKEVERAENDYDVVVYDNSTAGMAFLLGLAHADHTYPKIKVLHLSPNHKFQSAIVQGQVVEDSWSNATGFWREFENYAVEYYKKYGINPFKHGRFVVEPEVAEMFLNSIKEEVAQKCDITFRNNVDLISADDEEKTLIFQSSTGEEMVSAKNFVDASKEGELARLFGAGYRIGQSDEIFNDHESPPPLPTKENNYETCPQALGVLFTLQLMPEGTNVVKVTDLEVYDDSTYDPSVFEGKINVSDFLSNSWPVRWMLPNNKMELNVRETDILDPETTFQWPFMSTQEREQVFKEKLNEKLHFVRYLQENGASNLSIAKIPSWPYVREMVGIQGVLDYTSDMVNQEIKKDPLARDVYTAWDWHHATEGPQAASHEATIYIPLDTVKVKGKPFLLAIGAPSGDWQARSAMRLEPVQTNASYVAAIGVTAAKEQNKLIGEIDYSQINPRGKLTGLGTDMGQ